MPRPQGGSRYLSARTTSKRVAERLEATLRAEVQSGRFVIPDGRPPTLMDWAAEFLATIPHKKTHQRYRSSIRKLLAYFNNARLTQVTVRAVEGYKQEKLKEGNGPATVNRDLAVLRRMMRLAKRQRLIAQSPFEDTEAQEQELIRFAKSR